jgi:hypothetical protein
MFWVKNLNYLMWIRDGKNTDPGYGMEKIQTRAGKNADPGWKTFGSRINIPHPIPIRDSWYFRFPGSG